MESLIELDRSPGVSLDRQGRQNIDD